MLKYRLGHNDGCSWCGTFRQSAKKMKEGIATVTENTDDKTVTYRGYNRTVSVDMEMSRLCYKNFRAVGGFGILSSDDE